jgi:dihydroorotate dehydrogenase
MRAQPAEALPRGHKLGANTGLSSPICDPIGTPRPRIRLPSEALQRMSWHHVISDFPGMVKKILEHATRYRITKDLDCDKNTVDRYENGAEPSSPDRVAKFIEFALRQGIDISEFQTFAPIYDFSPMQTYERRLAKGPPDFSWLHGAKTPPANPARFCDVTLDSPVGIASSPLTGDAVWSCSMLDLGYGPSSFKTRRSAEHHPYDPPLITSVLEPPELVSYDSSNPPEVLVTADLTEFRGRIPDQVNSIGVPSEKPAVWQSLYQRIQEHPRGKFMALSVMGDGDDVRSMVADFGTAVSAAKEVRPPIIEINISCPNLEKRVGELCSDLDLVTEICRKAREVLSGTGIPLVAKLPRLPEKRLRPLVEKIGGIVQAISYGNTLRVRPVRVNGFLEQRKPAFNDRLFGGLSGPSTYGLTLQGIQALARIKASLRMDFQVAAVGGITSPKEVLKLLESGADVVQVCTVAMFDPLFAWKVRHYLSQPSIIRQRRTHIERPAVEEELTILAPIEDYQIAAYRNARMAAKLIGKKVPERAVSEQLFQKRWNVWMRSQKPEGVGLARRSHVNRPRTVDDWIREFSL